MQIIIIVVLVLIVLTLIKLRKQKSGNLIEFHSDNSNKVESEKANDSIAYFLNNKIGYFTQAKTKENAIFISESVKKLYYKSMTQKEFVKLILERIPDYDVDTLKIESDNFILMADNYSTWKYIQRNKDILPFLKYNAITDETTCTTCKKLNNIVRSVDDEFWDIYFPPNCPECRCIVQLYDESDIKKPTDLTKKKLIRPMDCFAINVGKHDLKSLYE
ncbi:MAG: phage minor head protein [Paludibacter sp.]|nr:phage minor head protein [Paludibacter sp.]